MTKNKSRPVALLMAGLLWAGFAQAQESANSSGGDATGSGGTIAYSIGQVVYTTNTGSNGSVAKGVQHAYEIFTSLPSATYFIHVVNQENKKVQSFKIIKN